MTTRGRLFWKILLGFWLIFLLITQILWAVFTLYGNDHEPPEENGARRIVELQMTAVETALKTGGMPALQSLMAQWPAGERALVNIMPLAAAAIDSRQTVAGNRLSGAATGRLPGKAAAAMPQAPGRMPASVERLFTDIDGQLYRVSYDAGELRHQLHNNRNGSILHMPSPLFWLGVTVGLLFSMLMAWNLTRPMRQLQKAFNQVSLGDLSVRLLPLMRRRHDEISDVARDFDAMAERLQVLVSNREALLHDVSHELRSPLARLQLAIGLAHQNQDNLPASLKRIEHEAARMDKMIGDVLALSRAGHGNPPDEDYFDLRLLIESILSDARYEAQNTGVAVEFDVNVQCDYTVRGNAEMMRRAVENIVRNALRFSIAGQRVDIRLTQHGARLDILVTDQGPGVEESKLSSIFDPFVRINSLQGGKGYGLGLAITRKVVLEHAGQVEATNLPDGGLAIAIHLPHWRDGQP